MKEFGLSCEGGKRSAEEPELSSGNRRPNNSKKKNKRRQMAIDRERERRESRAPAHLEPWRRATVAGRRLAGRLAMLLTSGARLQRAAFLSGRTLHTAHCTLHCTVQTAALLAHPSVWQCEPPVWPPGVPPSSFPFPFPPPALYLFHHWPSSAFWLASRSSAHSATHWPRSTQRKLPAKHAARKSRPLINTFIQWNK